MFTKYLGSIKRPFGPFYNFEWSFFSLPPNSLHSQFLKEFCFFSVAIEKRIFSTKFEYGSIWACVDRCGFDSHEFMTQIYNFSPFSQISKLKRKYINHTIQYSLINSSLPLSFPLSIYLPSDIQPSSVVYLLIRLNAMIILKMVFPKASEKKIGLLRKEKNTNGNWTPIEMDLVFMECAFRIMNLAENHFLLLLQRRDNKWVLFARSFLLSTLPLNPWRA